MQAMNIGELARRAEVNVDTVRYYERRGLLPAPARRASGYRQYGPGDVDRVRAIRRAQQLGFTLRETLELLPILTQSRPSCAALVRRARRKIDELSSKIRELEEAKTALLDLVEHCAWQPGARRRCELARDLAITDG